MRILPVIDLKQGQVVRGIAGQRDLYQPVRSQLAANPSAASIAAAFSLLGLDAVYVADLDAIGGKSPDWEQLGQIARHQSQIWLDSGTNTLDRVEQLNDFARECPALAGVIVGLESLGSPDDLAELFEAIGEERAIFSLDLQGGRPLSDSLAWRDLQPLEIVEVACRIGFRQLIVLDLASVGTGQGVSVEKLCRAIRDGLRSGDSPHVELIAGGGVRHIEDLRRLWLSGCHTALAASALHDGRLSREDLAEVRDW